MRLKRLRIGIDGPAVKRCGGVQPILGVGHVSGVEEGAGIGGMSEEPCVQFGLGGLPVRLDDSRFCLRHLLRDGLARGGWVRSLLLWIRSGDLRGPGNRGDEQDEKG